MTSSSLAHSGAGRVVEHVRCFATTGAYGRADYPLDVVSHNVVEYRVLLHAVRYATMPVGAVWTCVVLASSRLSRSLDPRAYGRASTAPGATEGKALLYLLGGEEMRPGDAPSEERYLSMNYTTPPASGEEQLGRIEASIVVEPRLWSGDEQLRTIQGECCNEVGQMGKVFSN